MTKNILEGFEKSKTAEWLLESKHGDTIGTKLVVVDKEWYDAAYGEINKLVELRKSLLTVVEDDYTLSGKDADRFIKRMVRKQKSRPTKKERKMFREIMRGTLPN